MEGRTETLSSFARFAFLIVAVSLAIRIAVLFFFWHTWFWQSGIIQDGWNKLAINTIMSNTFGFSPGEPTVQRGPLFPLVEMPLYVLFGERYLFWSIALLLLDTFTTILIIMLGRRLWGDRPALLAGLFHAVYLPAVYYTANIEQFTVDLPLGFLWFYLISAWDLRSALSKPHYVALGVVSGALILSKVVYLPAVLGSAAALVWLKRNSPEAKAVVIRAVAMLLIAGAIVAPWTYRNYIVTAGRFIPVQSMFWEAIWQKFVILELDRQEGWDRPSGRTLEYILSRQADLMRRVGDARSAELRGPDKELYYEKVFRGEVLEWMAADPPRYARNLLNNVWYFWVGAENRQKTLLMAGMQAPLLGAALLGLLLAIRQRRIGSLRFGLLLVLILWAEYTVVFGWGRYSLDTVPVLAVTLGVGIDAWFRRVVLPQPPPSTPI